MSASADLVDTEISFSSWWAALPNLIPHNSGKLYPAPNSEYQHAVWFGKYQISNIKRTAEDREGWRHRESILRIDVRCV